MSLTSGNRDVDVEKVERMVSRLTDALHDAGEGFSLAELLSAVFTLALRCGRSAISMADDKNAMRKHLAGIAGHVALRLSPTRTETKH